MRRAAPMLDDEGDVLIIGAAVHALGRGDQGGLAAIEAQPARAPLWRRPALIPYALAAMALLAIVGTDLTLRVLTARNEARLDALDAEFREGLRIKDAVRTSNAQVAVLQARARTLEVEAKRLSERGAALEGLTHRREELQALLSALEGAANDDIMLERLEQSPGRDRTLFVRGWALSNTAAQLFVNDFNRNLQHGRYRVQDSNVTSGQGRFGITGYTIEVWVVTNSEEG